MDLASLVRQAISVAQEVTLPLQPNIILYQWISRDVYATPGYADPITIPALVEDRDELRQVSTGETVRARSKVTILKPVPINGAAGRNEPIDSRDKIILPDGSTGPIIDIRGLVDPGTNRPFYGEIWIGVGSGSNI